jgi:hypothetical protein
MAAQVPPDVMRVAAAFAVAVTVFVQTRHRFQGLVHPFHDLG